jgi:N utilization substance protein A
LQQRALDVLAAREAAAEDKRKELGVEDDVAAIEGLVPAMLVVLGENGVKTLDDLGDLATDELVDPREGILKDFDLSDEEGNAIIMAARAHWFEGEEDAPAPATETAEQPASEPAASS